MGKILIIAASRSGTKYASEMYRAAGLDIGHERMGEAGFVGWQSVANIHRGWKPWSDGEFAAVWHQVRDPLATISSMQTHDPDMIRSIGRIVSLPPDPIAALMAYWLHWQDFADRHAEWRYRVEDLRAGGSAWPDAVVRTNALHRLGKIGAALSEDAPDIPRDTNRRKHGALTWADLENADGQRCAAVKARAIEYGYTQ